MTSAAEAARDYYDQEGADTFYQEVWGGNDIHVGLYPDGPDDVAAASQRTTDLLAAHVADLPAGTRAIDLGSGYGGTARHLASRLGMVVDGLNISHRQNARAHRLTAEAGLDHRVRFHDASFQAIPFPQDTFGLAWCQDALVHSTDRAGVLGEIDRVSQAGARVVITDLVATNECPAELEATLAHRLSVQDLGRAETYQDIARDLGWHQRAVEARTGDLVGHYTSVRREVLRRYEELARVDDEYFTAAVDALQTWVDAGQAGHLTWAVLVFDLA